MKIPILIEATSEQSYRATGGQPFAGSVEAGTPEAALEKMRQMIDQRLARGARIVSLEFSGDVNPWLDGAGMFRDDPFFDDWQQAITNYRRKANEQDDSP